MGFDFTHEGSFTNFLGIKFEKNKANNTVTLTQKGLIQKIIAATGMKDCNPMDSSNSASPWNRS
jgi:hypothetical protein